MGNVLVSNASAGGGSSGGAPSAHTHDDRYYTESEIDDFLSSKSDADHNHSGVYSPVAHNHDGIYALDDHSHSIVSETTAGFTPTLSGNAGQFLNGEGNFTVPGGSGDVLGPASNTDSFIPQWDGDDSKTLKGGLAVSYFATAGHNHSGVYSLVGHNHDGDYAALDHEHDADYSPVGHNHDADYADISHNHDDLYYTETEADNLFSTTDHDHDSDYADIGHDHDSDYADINHSHTTFADASHTHSEYSPTSHDHDGDYSAVGHDHDADYAAIAHSHQIVSETTAGFTPTLSGNAGQFLNGEGNFTAPAGGGDVLGPPSNPDAYIPLWDGEDSKTLGTGLSVSFFSPSDHDHSGVYSLVGHDHDASYSDIAHGHVVVSTETAGFCPTLSGNSAQFLNGDGDFTVPGGGGDVSGPAANTGDYLPQWDGDDSKTLKNGLAVSYFSASNHDHDSDYSDISHDHDSDYSAIGHDHSGTYLESVSGDATPSLSGTLDVSSNHLKNIKTATFAEVYDNGTHSSGTLTIDWNNGQKQKVVFDVDDFGVAFTSPTGPGNFSLIVSYTDDDYSAASWPVDHWLANNSSFAANSSSRDFLNIFYDGVEYYGAVGEYGGSYVELYALADHTHTTYADASHTHSEYSPTSHDHDDTYYTETEADNLFSTTDHNHDDRYYTETEADNLFSTTDHNHDDRYYTETEADNLFSTTAHDHDSDYSAVGHDHDASYADIDHNHDVASSTTSGFVPPLSGDSDEYLNGQGEWSTPAGGGGDGISAVYEDATPTLGGDLDGQGYSIHNVDVVSFAAEISNTDSGASATISWESSQKQHIKLTDDCAVAFGTSPGVGNYLLRIEQDTTGGRVATWDDNVVWAGAPTLSTDGGKVDIASFYYNGNTYFGVLSFDFGGTGGYSDHTHDERYYTETESDSLFSSISHTHSIVSTTTAGFVPTLSDSSTEYLNGQGQWSTPAGGGGGGLESIWEDSTPTLGGDLDAESNRIVNAKTITFGSVHDIGTHSSGTLTINWDDGQKQKVLIDGTGHVVEFSAPSGPGNFTLMLSYVDDGDGIDTWPSMGWIANNSTFSTSSTSRDLLSVYYDGSEYYASVGEIGGDYIPFAYAAHTHSEYSVIAHGHSEYSLGTHIHSAADSSSSGFMPMLDEDTSHFLRGDGAWAVPAGGGSGISAIYEDATPTLGGDLDAYGHAATNFGVIAFGTEFVNSDSGAIATISWDSGQKQYIKLTDSCVINFEAPPGVGNYLLRLEQDATGGREVTWDPSILWAGDFTPEMSTTGGLSDIASFYYNGSTYFGAFSMAFGTGDTYKNHTHDDRYYTETEADNLFSTTAHDHDGTYLTAVGEDATPTLGGDLNGQAKDLYNIKTVTFGSTYDMGTHAAGSGTLTVSWGNGQKQKVMFSGTGYSVEFVAPTGPGNFTLIIGYADDNDGPSSWPNGLFWAAGNGSNSFSQNSSSRDILSLMYDGTDYYCAVGEFV